MTVDTPSRPRLVIVAAVARNGAIGARNGLPWRLRTDLRRYKAITMGKPMIMGRKTYESIGKALPGRQTIVVTRDPGFAPADAITTPDLPTALSAGARAAAEMGVAEIVIAGGADIYAQMIGMVDALSITEVDLAPEADAFFPEIDPALWRETARDPHPPGPNDDVAFAFVDYVRRDREATLVENGAFRA
jgi:dihydrofolate reductase